MNDMTTLTIIKTVFDYFNVPIEIRDTKSRKREIVQSRQIAMYYLKNRTKLSLSAIGSMFLKDHATVIHSIKQVNNLSETDKCYRQDLKAIAKRIELRLFDEAPTNEWICKFYDTDKV